VRLVRVAAHLVSGVLTAGLVFPLVALETRRALRVRWARLLLDRLGVEIRVHGKTSGGLLVANHISWLDVFVIDATHPARSAAPVYAGATTLLESIRRITGSPGTVAELRFLTPLDPCASDRRALSAQAESSLREALRRLP
jgi:hypothetical protein